MIQDNPFSSMLGTIRQDAADRTAWPWRFGVIRSLSPLMVEVAGQTLKSGLWVNPLLLGRQGSAALTGLSGSLEESAGVVPITDGSLSGGIALSGVLAIGDRVVLLQSQDGQELVILCKAVSG